MLNIQLIKTAMRTQGLSGTAIAEACAVSKEAVSNWLLGESIPRPGKLALLAATLKLSVDQLFALDADEPSMPVVAYRMRANRALTDAAKEAGDEVARQLRQLLPYTGMQALFTPRHLAAPSLDDAYIATSAAATRQSLGINATAPATHDHLLKLFNDFGALLVPVFWGSNKDGHENAMSVYLPDSKASWVLFNMGCRLDDFSYWLAHEFGHCLTLHRLQGDDGEQFAERFAQQLLFPDALASQTSEAMAASSDPLAMAIETAGIYGVSIVTVVKAVDRAAQSAGKPVTGLATRQFYAQWQRSRKTAATAADALFGVKTPAPLDFILKSEQLFHTPVFRAMARWQRAEGGRSPAFIAAAFNLSLAEALKLSHALWELAD
ncbi:MAG: helix-turn-helix domain protein [Rhizobacter sp.]|nr:helix-turn-helix domain protein [Rhizobacter sp.]